MLENPKILLTILAISIILIVRLFRALKAEKKSRYDLLEKEKELNNFRGYKEEVDKLRKEISESLPKGVEEIASLWVDLNIVFERLEAEYELNEYLRKHRRRLNRKVQESHEVRQLKEAVKENKMLTYRLEIAEGKYMLAMAMLKNKYGEDNLDEEWSGYLTAIIKEREELDEQVKNLIKEEGICKFRIERLRKDIKEAEYELENISESYYTRVVSARVNLSKECSTPEVLKKISQAWANYKFLIWEKAVTDLEFKTRPISEETASDFRLRLRKYKEEVFYKYKECQYKYEYILSLFPELQEYIDGDAVREDVVEVTEEYDDKRIAYLSKDEWNALTETQKSQLALDRYNERRKQTNAQVGRDYEEYIAHLFRVKLKGCDVAMFGEQKGLNDLGRDLIVKHRGKVYIVQCKRWSTERVIREKHIMQLFGSTIEYCWESRKKGLPPLEMVGKSVIPVFVATTDLSDTAKQFTERLGVVFVKEEMGDYPQIKCNVGKDGEQIYHLPFDQQYNRVIIEPKKKEFMAWTVEEAEQKGFRRAKKYSFN